MTYSRRWGSGALLLLLALPASALAQRVMPGNSVNCQDTPTDVTYVFSATTPLLAKPSLDAQRITTTKIDSIAMVLCVIDGWARVWLVDEGKAPDAQRTGWFKSSPANPQENLLPESWFKAVLRKNDLAATAWPPATKSAVLRKRVRVGFTPQQVKAALDDPLSLDTEETAAGVTEVWTYVDQVITFRAKRVTAIRKSQ